MNYYQRTQSKKSKVWIWIVAIVAVALFAFAAGIRVQQYGLVEEIFSTNTKVNEQLPDELDYSSVTEVYEELKRRFDGELTEQQLLDGLKAGLAMSTGDPYTVYLNNEESEEFRNELNGTFTGIGAEIGIEDEVLIVVSPLEDFPAEKAGLRPKDRIIKIDDEDTFGMTIEEAVSKIRGPKGTEVALTIIRGNEQKVIKITRDKISVPSVKYEILKNDIGYLRITRFSEDTNALVSEAVTEFADKGVKRVILDLRNNSGGFLNTAVDVAGYWLDGDLVVEQREDSGEVVTDSLRASTGAPLKGIPTVVLINEGSASASEIVAGALADTDSAILIGKTSFGKGSVQELENLNGGGTLKVTIARWYTPNGRNIDKEGIKPDIEVEITDKDYKEERDPQKRRAINELKKQQ